MKKLEGETINLVNKVIVFYRENEKIYIERVKKKWVKTFKRENAKRDKMKFKRTKLQVEPYKFGSKSICISNFIFS